MLNIVSAPLGALVFSILPLYSIIVIDMATAAVAIVSLFFVHIPQPRHATDLEQKNKQSLWQDVGEGLRYIWRWPGLRALIMATLINFLVNPGFALMPLPLNRRRPEFHILPPFHPRKI